MRDIQPHKLAMIDWSHLLEDFLGNIGLTLDDYLQHMTGGWLFGYIEALKTAGVETVLFCFSATVTKTEQRVHIPTGATVCILPATTTYRNIRKVILNPYTTNVDEAVRNAKGWQRRWYSLLLHGSSYFATPAWNLFRQLKKHGCTAILCQDYEHTRFDICVIVGKALRLPVFATFQGGNWHMGKTEKWIRPFTLRACNGLIVASGAERQRLQEKYGLPTRKCKQIFNPVDSSVWDGVSQEDARRALGFDESTSIVAWHGRIDYYRKGLDVLLDAWEKMRNEIGEENLVLRLYGSGVNNALLDVRIESSPAKNIRWTASYTNDRKALSYFLSAADVYVFPSRNEGFPVAPLEAMATGLPVVAADAPGIADIFPKGEPSGGLVVPAGNGDALAAGLVNLLTQKERAKAMGQQGRKRIEENFSLHSVGRQLKEFIFRRNYE